MKHFQYTLLVSLASTFCITASASEVELASTTNFSKNSLYKTISASHLCHKKDQKHPHMHMHRSHPHGQHHTKHFAHHPGTPQREHRHHHDRHPRGIPLTPQKLQELTSLVKDTNSLLHSRIHAARILILRGDSQQKNVGLEVLRNISQHNDHPHHRIHASLTLALHGTESDQSSALAILQSYKNDKDLKVQRHAQRALNHLQRLNTLPKKI